MTDNNTELPNLTLKSYQRYYLYLLAKDKKTPTVVYSTIGS